VKVCSLEHAGWIKAEWKTSELGRRAKFYALTPSGRRRLEQENGRVATPILRDQPRDSFEKRRRP